MAMNTCSASDVGFLPNRGFAKRSILLDPTCIWIGISSEQEIAEIRFQ